MWHRFRDRCRRMLAELPVPTASPEGVIKAHRERGWFGVSPSLLVLFSWPPAPGGCEGMGPVPRPRWKRIPNAVALPAELFRLLERFEEGVKPCPCVTGNAGPGLGLGVCYLASPAAPKTSPCLQVTTPP